MELSYLPRIVVCSYSSLGQCRSDCLQPHVGTWRKPSSTGLVWGIAERRSRLQHRMELSPNENSLSEVSSFSSPAEVGRSKLSHVMYWLRTLYFHSVIKTNAFPSLLEIISDEVPHLHIALYHYHFQIQQHTRQYLTQT